MIDISTCQHIYTTIEQYKNMATNHPFEDYIKLEYVKIGESIQNIFQSHLKKKDCTIKVLYTGRRINPIKFVTTDKYTGGEMIFTDFKGLQNHNYYAFENLAHIKAELIKLIAVEKALGAELKKFKLDAKSRNDYIAKNDYITSVEVDYEKQLSTLYMLIDK